MVSAKSQLYKAFLCNSESAVLYSCFGGSLSKQNGFPRQVLQSRTVITVKNANAKDSWPYPWMNAKTIMYFSK